MGTCCACDEKFTKENEEARMRADPLRKRHIYHLKKTRPLRPINVAMGRQFCPTKRTKHRKHSLQLVCLHTSSKLDVCPPFTLTAAIRRELRTSMPKIPHFNLMAILVHSCMQLCPVETPCRSRHSAIGPRSISQLVERRSPCGVPATSWVRVCNLLNKGKTYGSRVL